MLANLGGLAEKYCYSDSNSCLIKLGLLGENIVNLMYAYDKIQILYDSTAASRIDYLLREGFLSRDLAKILHAIRKVRNKATHEAYESVEDDKAFLQMA